MLRREAANWLARLESGRDPNIERKFQHWSDADPRHATAFDRVRRSYEQAGLLRQSAKLASVLPEPTIKTASLQPRPALAAAVTVAILIPTGVLLYRDFRLPFGTNAVMLMTRVGEIKQVSLADGSKVTLDTSTKVEVEIGRSHRSVHLKYGRARFQIAQAGAPFVVQTAGTTIITRQGVIDVEEGAQQDRVKVLAGAADVRPSDRTQSPPMVLGAGEGVTMSSAGAEQKSVEAPAPDWTRGMLQFDGTPLADAVALANRYSERHIILVGDLNAVRVTGAFRAGDTQGLARALAAAFGLSLQQRADGTLVLWRSVYSNRQNKRGG
jgi:transmembrane sensor